MVRPDSKVERIFSNITTKIDATQIPPMKKFPRMRQKNIDYNSLTGLVGCFVQLKQSNWLRDSHVWGLGGMLLEWHPQHIPCVSHEGLAVPTKMPLQAMSKLVDHMFCSCLPRWDATAWFLCPACAPSANNKIVPRAFQCRQVVQSIENVPCSGDQQSNISFQSQSLFPLNASLGKCSAS